MTKITLTIEPTFVGFIGRGATRPTAWVFHEGCYATPLCVYASLGNMTRNPPEGLNYWDWIYFCRDAKFCVSTFVFTRHWGTCPAIPRRD